MRFEWLEDDEEADWLGVFRSSSIDGNPSPVEWLCEYTGEREENIIRGIGWHYPTFSDLVYRPAEEVTRDACEQHYGPDWREDDELIEAANEDWSRLFAWIEEELARCDWTTPATDEQQPRREGN